MISLLQASEMHLGTWFGQEGCSADSSQRGHRRPSLTGKPYGATPWLCLAGGSQGVPQLELNGDCG